MTATADETIEATTVAASMAAVVGTVGLAGAGAGVTTTNKIATQVSALIDGSSSDVSAASVSMKAEDTSKITALSAAAAAAFALSPDGAALAVGVTLSKNVIENTVEAKIKDATVTTPVTGLGGVSVIATSTPTISAKGFAGGLAAGVVAGAGAGVEREQYDQWKYDSLGGQRDDLLQWPTLGSLRVDRDLDGDGRERCAGDRPWRGGRRHENSIRDCQDNGSPGRWHNSGWQHDRDGDGVRQFKG